MSTTIGAPDAIVRPRGHFGFKVDPPVASKRRTETFTILNATKVTVHVRFDGLRTSPPHANVSSFARQDFDIDASAARDVYDYYVEIAGVDPAATGGFTLRATADSDPQIIID
jgi:hypothetical protein